MLARTQDNVSEWGDRIPKRKCNMMIGQWKPIHCDGCIIPPQSDCIDLILNIIYQVNS